MSTWKHRSLYLKVIGDAPQSIERKFEDRYRIVYQCTLVNKTTDWWYRHKDRIFAEYKSLSNAPFPAPNGTKPNTGEHYPNMRLVGNDLTRSQNGEPLVEFIYETLTDTWTSAMADVTGSTENGLKTLLRTITAIPGTTPPYNEDDVGVKTITIGTKTLYLSGFEDKSTDKQGLFETRWHEKGILSVRTPKVGGTQLVVVQALGMTEAEVTAELDAVTANHKLVDKTEGDYEGFKTVNFSYEVDDFNMRSQTENGLQLLSRTQLSTTDYPDGDVGVDEYAGLKLNGELIDNGNTIKKRESKWAQSGLIRVRSRPGPSSIPSTKYVTWVSQGVEQIPPGVHVDQDTDAVDGFSRFVNTSLQSIDPPVDDITSTTTYADSITVKTPGTVNLKTVSKTAGGISGTIAVADVTPPRQQTIKAVVTIEITKTPPTTVDLAFDLGSISCSVTYISMSENYRGSDVFVTESGNTRFSGARKTAGMSARITHYPECYLINTSASGTFTYISSWENPSTVPNVLLPVPQDSTTRTFADGTGATSANGYVPYGIVKRKPPRPILTDLNGITYWEVITWTVPKP